MAHTGITCDICGASPIQGTRFKCLVCADTDLCAACVAYAGDARHPSRHPMLRLSTPVHAGWEQLLPRVLFPASLVLPLEALEEAPTAEAAAAVGVAQDALAAAAGLAPGGLQDAYGAALGRKSAALKPVSPPFAQLLARLRSNDASLVRLDNARSLPDLCVNEPRDCVYSSTSPYALEEQKLNSSLALLEHALNANHTLEELDLSGISTDRYRTNRFIVTRLGRLRVLNLSGMCLRPAWVMSVTNADGSPVPPDWTGVGPACFSSFRELCAELLSNTRLERLVLRDCEVCDDVARMLAAALRVNRTLRVLDLSGRNDISNGGTAALVAALRVNTALTHLHVDTLRESGRDTVLAEWDARGGG
jgi:hypothetical protein